MQNTKVLMPGYVFEITQPSSLFIFLFPIKYFPEIFAGNILIMICLDVLFFKIQAVLLQDKYSKESIHKIALIADVAGEL